MSREVCPCNFVMVSNCCIEIEEESERLEVQFEKIEVYKFTRVITDAKLASNIADSIGFKILPLRSEGVSGCETEKRRTNTFPRQDWYVGEQLKHWLLLLKMDYWSPFW